MRNVVLFFTLFVACAPQHQDPTSTLTPTTSTSTDGASVTSVNPTTEVNGSTGMPDTDDLPPLTTSSTTVPTTTGDPPVCSEFVMCGESPCQNADGPICAPDTCAPMLCGDCPGATCGDINGQSVCIVAGEVPCAVCTPFGCAQCPDASCEEVGEPFCMDPTTGQIACVQDLLFCPALATMCTEDAQCGEGAPNCTGGQCRAACATTDDCGLKSLCAEGICVDAEHHPVCAVIPHGTPEPEPTCEPLGPCMSDIDCPAGASTCWDLVKNEPTMPGMIGQCVSACIGADCPAGIACSSKGFCADDLGLPVCTLP